MHRIAEEMLKPRRELETGNEIALRYTTGGFGTPPWEHGLASGTSGQLRVEGLDLVGGISAGAEHDDRHLAPPADSGQHLGAVHIG